MQEPVQGSVTVVGLVRAIAGAVALGGLVVLAVTLSGTGPVSRGAEVSDDTVVARVSGGPMQGAAELAPLLAATRAAPGDVTAAHAAAAALISAGRKAGKFADGGGGAGCAAAVSGG